MKNLIYILILFFLFSCEPKDGKDGKHPDEGTSALVEVENPMGFAEAASCLRRGDINLTAMDSDYKQLNDYNATTKNDLGLYVIEADVSGIKALTGFRGYCFRETADGYVYLSMDAYHDLADNMNVNIPGTIQGELSTYYKDDEDHEAYNDRELALEYAKDEVLKYFGFTDFQKIDFSTATIQGDTTNDAIMTIISSTIDSRHDTGPEMNDDMSLIAEGIYKGDLVLKSEIIADRDALKIKDIKERVESIAGSCPPIWELSPHQEYADLLFRTPDIVQSFNIDNSSAIIIDTSAYNSFAYPVIYNPSEKGKYFASELAGHVFSIWSVGTCNQGVDYPCPLSNLVNIEELNEILLEPEMNYNGYLGNHELIPGEQYFIVQNFESGTAPSHVSDGEMVPFGRNLATVDNNWQAAIGYDNVTNWFRRSFKWFLTN